MGAVPVDSVAIARAVLAQLRNEAQASIIESASQHPQLFVVQTFFLDTAVLASAPISLGFPFQSCFVASATDNTTSISLAVGDRSLMGAQNLIPLNNNGGLNLPRPVSGGFLSYAAQAGKSITLCFLLEGVYTSGKIVTVQSGTVQVGEGTTVTSRAVAGLSITAVASIILVSDVTRLKETLQNQDSISVWLGDASVTDNTGANPGIELQPGQTWTSKNTAALYAVSKGTATKFARLKEA